MIFDGRKFAKTIEEKVRSSVATMLRKPKIVSILVGNDPASELYTRLKQEAANRVGIDFEIIRLDSASSKQAIESTLEKYVTDDNVSGIMVQLPIPGISGVALGDILAKIPISKDVDGLRWETSHIMPATVASVLSILTYLESDDPLLFKRKFVVLGSGGAVGKPLVHCLREKGVVVSEVEWDTPDSDKILLEGEVIISCVGKPGIVTGAMVRDGIVAIDVGMSQVDGKVVGDMTSEVYQKASFAVPVPGGVGPVTIACLLQNVLELSEKL